MGVKLLKVDVKPYNRHFLTFNAKLDSNILQYNHFYIRLYPVVNSRIRESVHMPVVRCIVVLRLRPVWSAQVPETRADVSQTYLN